MKKIKNPLILLAFAATAICGLGIASFTSKNADCNQTLASAPSTTYPVVSPDVYYANFDDSGSGETFLSNLRTFNMQNRKSNITYKSLNGIYCYTDYDPATVQYDSNNQPYGTKLLSFYSGKSTTSYNKEHVWPNSRGGGSDKGKSGSPYVEDDVYMPRPTIKEENSDRGNSAYVEGMCHSSNGWDPVTAFEKTLGVYESIRGESARIIFYCMTVNSKLRLVDDANTDFAGEGGRVTMGKLSDMLKWHLTNPVNERELNRQSGGQYLQGNRNAFVDHRSYACKIWGHTNQTTESLCNQYNGWTDGDEPTPVKTLVSIDIDGNPSKTSYTSGEEFSTAGLTVTANYSDKTSGDITDKATFSVSPKTLSVGDTSVTVTANYQGKSASKTIFGLTVKAADVPVTSVEIINSKKDYFVGESCSLDVTVLPSNATDKSLTYKSNNTSVATVDASGNVSFKTTGSATVTATSKNGKSDSITFSISNVPVHVESISASLPTNSYYVGDTAKIQYTVLPDDADNKGVSFSSSNTSVATVDASGNITFKAAGSVVFTVASKENSSIKDTISVSVSNRPVEDIPVESVSLSVAAGSSEFEVGDEVQINATITPANATNKHLTYSSNNTDIATVTSNGLVSFKAVGNVIITATSNNGKTSQLSFTVKDNYVPVTSVSLSTEKTNVVVGEKATLNVSVLPENATDKTLVFSSTNEEIAKVINNEVSFNKSGRVVIKATATNGVYGEIEFTVSGEHIPVTSISISLDKTSYKVGETAKANVGILPEDATNKSVKFSSSSEEVARIDSDTGDVEFIKEGSVTFTVKSLDNNSLSASVIVTVVAREEPIRISILENPHKTTYSPNEQFDPTGLVVVADYLDGCSIKIDGENLTLSAPDMSTSGFKTITVSYKNTFVTTFNILVLEVEPSDLIIEKYPSKTTYYKSEEFNPIGMKVYAVIGDKKEDVSDIVTFDYDFEVSTKVTVRFKGLWKIINIIIESGEITNEHKAADFAYIVKDVLEDVSVNDLTLADWNAFEHYYNMLDEAAKKVLRETVTKYSANSVEAAEDLTATLKQCAENYDEIYLNHKNQGFRDFMGRNPVKPNDSDKKDQSNNSLLILIGIGAGVVVLIVLIIVISVSAAKRSKRKHAQ